MKLHRAAALALVGWYLMLPPVTRSGVIVADSPKHHYPGWTMKAEFKTLDECNRAQSALVGQGIRHSLDWPVDQSARDANQQNFKAQCVSEETLQGWKKLEAQAP